MNEISPKTDDLARLIDRLVDGELPPAERRALLLRLESEPDGWRRCALGFLEAQAWRDAITAPAAVPELRIASAVETRGTVRPKRRHMEWAIAASLIAIAFVVGRAARPSVRTDSPPPLASKSPTASAETPTGAQTSPPVLVDERLSLAAERALARPRVAVTPVELPDELRRVIEREGFRVEQAGRITADRDDGATAVESVRVRYVGHHVY